MVAHRIIVFMSYVGKRGTNVHRSAGYRFPYSAFTASIFTLPCSPNRSAPSPNHASSPVTTLPSYLLDIRFPTYASAAAGAL